MYDIVVHYYNVPEQSSIPFTLPSIKIEAEGQTIFEQEGPRLTGPGQIWKVGIFDWASFVLNQMAWDNQQTLNQYCPATFETPAQTQIKIDYTCTPATSNPLGAKGCGEAGTIAAPAAVMNAVIDAIGTDVSMPATAEKVWKACKSIKKSNAKAA